MTAENVSIYQLVAFVEATFSRPDMADVSNLIDEEYIREV